MEEEGRIEGHQRPRKRAKGEGNCHNEEVRRDKGRGRGEGKKAYGKESEGKRAMKRGFLEGTTERQRHTQTDRDTNSPPFVFLAMDSEGE